MENQNNRHLPSKQERELESTQNRTLIKITDSEKKILAASIVDINTLRDFPLEPEELEDWAVMIKKAIPDVNPIMIEEAIIDLASGKREYIRENGVKSLITAIQFNSGQNWYWDPNK